MLSQTSLRCWQRVPPASSGLRLGFGSPAVSLLGKSQLRCFAGMACLNICTSPRCSPTAAATEYSVAFSLAIVSERLSSFGAGAWRKGAVVVSSSHSQGQALCRCAG